MVTEEKKVHIIAQMCTSLRHRFEAVFTESISDLSEFLLYF